MIDKEFPKRCKISFSFQAENNSEGDGPAAGAAAIPNDQESVNAMPSLGLNQPPPTLGAAAAPQVSSGHGRSGQAGLPMGASANSLANQVNYCSMKRRIDYFVQ